MCLLAHSQLKDLCLLGDVDLMDSCLSASINFAYVGKNIIDLGRVGRREGGTRARRDKLLFLF